MGAECPGMELAPTSAELSEFLAPLQGLGM